MSSCLCNLDTSLWNLQSSQSLNSQLFLRMFLVTRQRAPFLDFLLTLLYVALVFHIFPRHKLLVGECFSRRFDTQSICTLHLEFAANTRNCNFRSQWVGNHHFQSLKEPLTQLLLNSVNESKLLAY